MSLLKALFGSGGQQQTSVGAATEAEQIAGGVSSSNLQSLDELIKAMAPSQGQSVDAANQFRGLLSQLAGTPQNVLPSAEDISQSRNLTQNMFAGERNNLDNIFQQQEMESNRQAAQLGRSTADPILQARLRTNQAQQLGALGARETMAAQELAMQLPSLRQQSLERQASFAEQLQNQGIANRSNLIQLGSNLQAQLANIRGMSITTNNTTSPSVFGAISGVANLGMNIATGGDYSRPTVKK